MQSLATLLINLDDYQLANLITDLSLAKISEPVIDLYRAELDRRWRQMLIDCGAAIHCISDRHPLNLTSEECFHLDNEPPHDDYVEINRTITLDSECDEIPF